MGFNIEEFGINSVIIKSHPVWLPKGNEDNSIKKVLDVTPKLIEDVSVLKALKKSLMAIRK